MLYTTAYEFLKRFDFDEVKRSIYAQTPADVERALAHTHRLNQPQGEYDAGPLGSRCAGRQRSGF